MAHFVQIENGIVTNQGQVINNPDLLDENGEESEEIGIAMLTKMTGASNWKQVSYNTSGGVHLNGGTPFRLNYPGVGWLWNEELNGFTPPQPYPSWTLDEVKGQWNPPVPYPEIEVVEGEMAPMYSWNEDEQKWDEHN